MMIYCPAREPQKCHSEGREKVKSRIDNLLLSQYKNSPVLISYITVFLNAADDLNNALCSIDFDIDTSTGESLTILGSFVGFPRLACNALSDDRTLCKNLCGREQTRRRTIDRDNYFFDDDELYRRYLKAFIFATNGRGLAEEFQDTLKILYGDKARLVEYGGMTTVGDTGRALDEIDEKLLPLVEDYILPYPMFGRAYVTINAGDEEECQI